MTKNLIFSLCRSDSAQKNAVLANAIIIQILNIIQKNVNNSEVRILKLVDNFEYKLIFCILGYSAIFQNVNFVI